MSAPMLPLLHLKAGEVDAALRLYDFAAAHPGVTVVTPSYRDEPWRADLAKGMIPGEGPRTSGGMRADWPSGLLVKLEKLFAGRDPEDAPG